MIASLLTGLALLVFAFAPLAVAYWKPRARLPAAVFYGLLLSSVAVHYTGLSFGSISSPAAPAAAAASEVTASDELTRRCNEALELAEKGSLLRDVSDPGRVVVDRALWNQLPGFVKEGLVRCLEMSHAEDQPGIAIEIVEE